MSIRRRNGKYQVRVHGGRARTFTLHKDALTWAREQERRKELGELYREAPESFGAFLDSYLERKRQAGLRPGSIARMEVTAKKLAPLRGLLIPQVSRAVVEDFVAALGPSRTTEMALTLLKVVLRSARARGQSVDEAVLETRGPRYEKREARAIDREAMYLIASWMPEYLRRIVPIAGVSGMRQGELFSLEDSDLSLDAGTLRVRKGKTASATRTVYLSKELVNLFREQLLARSQGTSLVFATHDGRRLDKNHFMFNHFRPARKRAGYSDLAFHHLRHSAISLMAVAGWRPEHIARQVGHSDGGALIFKRYRHLFDGEMEAQVAKLDAVEVQG